MSRQSNSLNSLLQGLTVVTCIGFAAGCGSYQRQLIFNKTIDIPNGRFVGPIDVDVPRRADQRNRDFEIEAELSAACGPQLKLATPDGEVAMLGDEDENWQAWLVRRAMAGSEADQPTGETEQTPSRAPKVPGHWTAVQTESWPGQLTFLQIRKKRCSSKETYSFSYLNAFDESGRITIWADTPQEIANAKIKITIHALIDVKAEAEAAARIKGYAQGQIKAQGSVSGQVIVTKLPPEPPPKKENPPPAKAEGATWEPGYWIWNPGSGKWIWQNGHWGRPQNAPPAKTESPGNPPNEGCPWIPGYWQWINSDGHWEWIPGHWNAPPPKVETPPPPDVPEQKWVPGHWVEVNGRFEWSAGYWGNPEARAETPPPPPSNGVRWVAGIWIKVKGKWVWSPGYYERSGRPPPAPKAETPPPSPAPGSVWLGGYWRWVDAKNDYEWTPGHWEIPPGKDYVWVADPPPPNIGVPISGHWELRVKVNTKGSVEVRP